MEWLTILIAATAGLIVLATRPLYGLCTYLAVLLLYPDYLRVSFGTIDISASRIIVVVLLARCVCQRHLIAHFRWNLVDTAVTSSMVIYTAALSFTTPADIWIENRAGFVMDSYFAYLVVRLIITDRPVFVIILKALSLITVLLAVHAATESLTGWSIYAGLGQYCPWAPNKGAVYQVRFGLNRAEGPYAGNILFGLFFATMFPLMWLLRLERPPWRSVGYSAAVAALLGVAATISSGPYTATAVMATALMLERAKQWVKPLIIALLVGAVSLEIASERHFYDPLLDRLALDSRGTGWYRSQLFEVAIQKLPEYWATGYGLTDPGWGPLIDGRQKTDIVNDYILHAARYGLLGFVAFVSVMVAAMLALIRTYRRTHSLWMRSCTWYLGSTLVGMMLALFTVSLFTQMVSVFYMLIGLHGAVPRLSANVRPPINEASRLTGR